MGAPNEHAARLALATAAMDELDRNERDVLALPYGSNTENAARALAVARVCARRAAWWKVLYRHALRTHEVPHLHRYALLVAAAEQREKALFWRDTAADWTARAEGRPTSDAAGALSNWHELGVA